MKKGRYLFYRKKQLNYFVILFLSTIFTSEQSKT